jgi:uncharacterized membrane protein HdeD (DUF308 family)
MKGTCLMLKQNESSTDRIIRVVIGIVILLAGAFWLTGLIQTIAYVVGVIALITGIIGFCGLYALLGISTKLVNKKS